jgi:hypothetical protein
MNSEGTATEDLRTEGKREGKKGMITLWAASFLRLLLKRLSLAEICAKSAPTINASENSKK